MNILTHTQEFQLYATNREEWIRYSAQLWIHRMQGKTAAEKREVWGTIPEDVQEELRRIKRA
jgi:hypothetical protein